MQAHYDKHAQEVVERFKLMLDSAQVDAIGEVHFSELETLVSAALGVTDSKARHAAAKAAEALAYQFRQEANSVE